MAPSEPGCRTGDHNNTVHVVGHHLPLIQFHVGDVNRDAFPVVANHLPPFTQAHRTVHNLAQQALPAVHADSDQVGTG